MEGAVLGARRGQGRGGRLGAVESCLWGVGLGDGGSEGGRGGEGGEEPVGLEG